MDLWEEIRVLPKGIQTNIQEDCRIMMLSEVRDYVESIELVDQRKLHQEFLAPVQGTDPFPPSPHDLPRLQGEQASDQGPGGREKDGRGEGVPQTLRDPSEREQRGTKHE